MKEIEHLLPILHQWAAESDYVQRLWVYGSCVPGGRRPPRADSDLDVAIEVVHTALSNHYAWWLFDHKEWREDLNARIPLDVHLTHYHPDIPDDHPVEDGNVKKEVDRYGYLVYDRSNADTSSPT
jgi:predicted nucleotidyltransferase